jgi:hypothetical protein
MDVSSWEPSMTLDLLVEGRIATLAGEAGYRLGRGDRRHRRRVVAAGPRADLDPLAGGATRRTRLAPDEIVLPRCAMRISTLWRPPAPSTRSTCLVQRPSPMGSRSSQRRTPAPRRSWLEGYRLGCHALGRVADRYRSRPRRCGRPAFLWSHELHQVWADFRGLAAAGIDATTSDPPDGTDPSRRDWPAHRDAPRGRFEARDASCPEPTREWLATAVEAYCRGLLAYGIVAGPRPRPARPGRRSDRRHRDHSRPRGRRPPAGPRPRLHPDGGTRSGDRGAASEVARRSADPNVLASGG